MSRDIEMDDTSTMMCEHEEDEQNFEPDRVYREEVDRNELGHMIGEERSPRLGWRLGMADHCIWQRTPGKSLCPVSGVRREFEALPKSGCHDSWFESDHASPSKHGDVQTGRDESSKSSTTEIPDDANRRRFQV